MLGDAAHQTPPSGDGVNQAMLDALELYEALCIEQHSCVHEAIKSYEKKMLTRTFSVNKEALQQVDGMLSANNLQYMLNFFKEIK